MAMSGSVFGVTILLTPLKSVDLQMYRAPHRCTQSLNAHIVHSGDVRHYTINELE